MRARLRADDKAYVAGFKSLSKLFQTVMLGERYEGAGEYSTAGDILGKLFRNNKGDTVLIAFAMRPLALAGRVVLEWSRIHRQELVDDWERARAGQPHRRIVPLE